MTVIINPGAHINPDTPNTYERARQHADKWFTDMKTDGFGDIELIDNHEHTDGRWHFHFRHRITGITITLDQHGIDNVDQYIFTPRVYWNGSSSATPTMDDFKAPGYVMTFRAESPDL